MVYITGDTHRGYDAIEAFCKKNDTTKHDLIIVLGDNGVNYYGGKSDSRIKNRLSSLPITFFFIRGNHDMRPPTDSYTPTFSSFVNGLVLTEEKYPSLLFAIDGECYTIQGKSCFVLGGAYSVDKHRILYLNANGNHNYRWFKDEQLSKAEMAAAERDLERLKWRVDYMFTHTCPEKYTPKEAFMPFLRQEDIDKTMEKWLDSIEERLHYEKWFCGHWHINKTIDSVKFLYEDIIELR